MFGIKWLSRGRAKEPQPVEPAAPPPTNPALGGFESLFGQQAVHASKNLAVRGPVVVVGNCLAEMIASSLPKVPIAAKRYEFVGVPLHLKSVADPDVRKSLSSASHVFMQAIATQHADLIQSVIPANCGVTVYPDLALRSLWPFDVHSADRDHDPAIAAKPDAPFRHHDSALAKLRQIEPDKKKRFERYRNLDFEWASAVDRVIAAQQRFLESIDEQTGAYMGRFIARHYKSRQLFYDSVHPSAVVFQELCDFCWRKLELPNEVPVIEGMDGFKTWSVPVHPRIAERLGLEWASEYTRYQYGTLGEVTWGEWVRGYIDTFG